MVNLREQVERDLAISLEGQWSLPCDLIDPDGIIYTQVPCQFLYDTVIMDPETGERAVSNEPIAVFRRSTLSRVPVAGEKWLIRAPEYPSPDAPLVDFIISATRPPEGGASLGIIRLYLRKAEQS